MDLAQLVPGRTDRALFVGQTGSGKTTLARVLLGYRRYVVVHDGKGTINWPGYTLVRSLDELHELDPVKVPRITYRPNKYEDGDDDAINAFFLWVYERRRTTLYIDEAYAVSNNGRMGREFRACLTRGREHKVEVWAATQRPTWVPVEVMSEAEHVFAFRLKMAADRDKLEAFTGVPSAAVFALGKREFIYSRQDGEARGPLRLAL